MQGSTLNSTEQSILYTLRHAPIARYAQLMKPTGLESDDFKFHIRKLVKAGYVEKMEGGEYRLTLLGKEFGNDLDKTSRTRQKQPKLSLFLVISRLNASRATEYLLQKRLRSPFYGYFGCLSGPAKWGEEFEVTAASEILKQTGLTASFTVRLFTRMQDYATPGDKLLEDKLFVVLEASSVSGKLTNDWSGGYNAWMTLDELSLQDNYYDTTRAIIHDIQIGEPYHSRSTAYGETQY